MTTSTVKSEIEPGTPEFELDLCRREYELAEGRLASARKILDVATSELVDCARRYGQAEEAVRHGGYGDKPAKSPVVVRKGVTIEMCQHPTCVLWAGHPKGEHRDRRVSMLACPHNVPNFGPGCPICD